jgi:hypothetical protein
MKALLQRLPLGQRSSMVLVVIGIGAYALPLAGQPPEKPEKASPDLAVPTKDELADQRLAFIKSALSQYTVQVNDREEKAKVSDLLLRWSNPVSGVKDGAIAVYTFNGGRPVVIGQFHHGGGAKRWVNEFAVIASDDVSILRSDRPFWSPSEYICRFTDVPESPTPAATVSKRLAQMRKIAVDFSVVDHFGFETAQITKHGLRLLPQPVYRYSEKGKILDGALFVFALGTDPECNLLLEAYEDENGGHYRYAFAPMSIYELEARYRDNLVWQIERRIIFGANCRKYYALTYGALPSETVPD